MERAGDHTARGCVLRGAGRSLDGRWRPEPGENTHLHLEARWKASVEYPESCGGTATFRKVAGPGYFPVGTDLVGLGFLDPAPLLPTLFPTIDATLGARCPDRCFLTRRGVEGELLPDLRTVSWDAVTLSRIARR